MFLQVFKKTYGRSKRFHDRELLLPTWRMMMAFLLTYVFETVIPSRRLFLYIIIICFENIFFSEELSPELQSEVSSSHDGRFYQDFYKVIRQSEKHDNLQNVILDLKSSFHGYPLYVGCKQPFSEDKTSPKGIGINSRANEGNILQAINLSLNGENFICFFLIRERYT